jgi:hypothetical protein
MWLEGSRRVRESLGLPCTEKEQNRLWYWKVAKDSSNWEIPNLDDRFPFDTVYTVIVDDEEKVLGYVNWEYLLTNKTIESLNTLGVLIFPWEDQPRVEKIEYAVPDYQLCITRDIVGAGLNLTGISYDGLMNFFKNPSIVNYNSNKLKLGVHLILELTQSNNVGLSEIEHREWMDYFQTVVIKSDEQCIRFLSSNGFGDKIRDGSFLCKPTARDIQHYMKMYGITTATHPDDMPKIMFKVPFEDVCYGTRPVYDGGIVHISSREIPQWCWDIQLFFFNTTLPRFVYLNRETLLQDERIAHLVNLAKHKPVVSNITRGNVVDPIIDIEDLMNNNKCPGCIKSLITPLRHFKDGERMALTSQLRCGKIDKNSIVTDIFQETQPYWNFSAYWDANYAAAPCTVFIDNKLKNRKYTMQCPHASPNLTPEDTRTHCQNLFVSLHPKKAKPHKDNLKYPFQWFLWLTMR